MRKHAVLAAIVAGAIGAGALVPSSAVALRKATPSERVEIIAFNARLMDQRGICRSVGVIVRVSNVDPRYSRLSFNNRVRDRKGCGVGDGFRVIRKVGVQRYRHIADFSWTGAPCFRIPRRVALDLVADAARRDATFRRCER